MYGKEEDNLCEEVGGGKGAGVSIVDMLVPHLLTCQRLEEFF